MKTYEQTVQLLETLKLKGVSAHLDELITDAEREKHSYISFLFSCRSIQLQSARLTTSDLPMPFTRPN